MIILIIMFSVVKFRCDELLPRTAVKNSSIPPKRASSFVSS